MSSSGWGRRLALVRATEPVVIELRATPPLTDLAASSASAGMVDPAALPTIDGVFWDKAFALVPLHATRPRREPRPPVDLEPRLDVDHDGDARSYLARGWVDGHGRAVLEKLAGGDRGVVTFSVDLPIILSLPGDDAAADRINETIRQLVGIDVLADSGFDGHGVSLAIVDAGLNGPFLERTMPHLQRDVGRSWTADPAALPYEFRVGHGTMCAFDAALAAPRCTLLDIAAFRPFRPGDPGDLDGPLPAMLSDAVRAFSFLCGLMVADARAGRRRPLVVSNSWEVDTTQDYPSDSPANYGSNPDHALNKMVRQLALLGADIVFSAGNTTARERENGPRPISGANSHPSVLTVGAVDLDSRRLDISRPGPGVLCAEKPDIAAFAGFLGSGIMGGALPDEGTSAACALAAGVVAAIRSGFPADPSRPEASPAALRAIIKKQARHDGSQGFDHECGWGVIDAAAIAEALTAPPANYRPPGWLKRVPVLDLRPRR